MGRILTPAQDADAYNRIAKLWQSSESAEEIDNDLPFQLGENYVIARIPSAVDVQRSDEKFTQIKLMVETAVGGWGFLTPSESTTRRDFEESIETGPVSARRRSESYGRITISDEVTYRQGGTVEIKAGSTGTTHKEKDIGDRLLLEVDAMIEAYIFKYQPDQTGILPSGDGFDVTVEITDSKRL